MSDAIQRLTSRKLGVSVATVVAIVVEIEDPVRAAIVAVVAIAYVLGQAFVDGRAVQVADAVTDGIAAGKAAAKAEP
jgi:hypothetical protein